MTADRPEGAGIVLPSRATTPICRCCRSSPGSTSSSWPIRHRGAGCARARLSPRRPAAGRHQAAASILGEGACRRTRRGRARRHRDVGYSVLPSHSAAAVRYQVGAESTRPGSVSGRGASAILRMRGQIQRALDLHERLFGVRPKGVWPSEGSVSEEVVASRTSKASSGWRPTKACSAALSATTSIADGDHLQVDGADELYNIYRYQKGQAGMHMVFRDHRSPT